MSHHWSERPPVRRPLLTLGVAVAIIAGLAALVVTLLPRIR
jgi:hypothetical protein